jgi:hypothetical protein
LSHTYLQRQYPRGHGKPTPTSVLYAFFQVIVVVVQVGAVKIYAAAAASGGAQEKGKSPNRMKLSLPPQKNWCTPTTTHPGFGPNSGFWCCVFLTFTKYSK